MRTIFWTATLVAALALPIRALAQSEESQAGDVTERGVDVGPLRDRVVPVSGHLFLKKGRLELSPSVSVTIRDAFFTKYLLGGALTYHLTETWGLTLRGGYSFPVVSGAAQICTTEATSSGAVRGCRLPRFNELDGRAPGQITALAGLDVVWEPIYGKLALWSELFIHLDLYLVAGPALIQYAGPPSAGGAGSERVFTAGGNVGLGTRLFFGKWFAVRGELRDLLYVERVATGNGSSFRNQILFELGFSFFLPTSFGS